MIEAKVICDSVSPRSIRLTTMALRYPKFIHGELMTHRVFSRNASSSRAIPTAKLIEEARSDELRAAPVFWGKNQKGMQAAEELSKEPVDPEAGSDWGAFDQMSPYYGTQLLWKCAAEKACEVAEQMVKLGAHKQIVNRLLEPFTHINVLVTATEWDNFFGLRLHKDAQPEMRALAVAMWEARMASTPKLLTSSDWHLPFIDGTAELDAQSFSNASAQAGHYLNGWMETYKVQVRMSVARCARVSYLSFETGKPSTVEEDLALYDRLMGQQPLHASPAEHQATPDTKVFLRDVDRWEHSYQHGNFTGWRQFRKMLPGESHAPLPEEYR